MQYPVKIIPMCFFNPSCITEVHITKLHLICTLSKYKYGTALMHLRTHEGNTHAYG